jgi:hypothetical protein
MVDSTTRKHHSHRPFTRHAAFQNMSADAGRRQGE